MPASFTAKFNFGYGWFLGEDPGVEPLDYTTKVLDAVILDGFAQDIANTAGLTYGYRGGWMYDRTTHMPLHMLSGLIVLPPNNICYIERSDSGVVSFSTVGWTYHRLPMAIAITNNFEIISVQDCRIANFSFPNLVTSVFGRWGDVIATFGDYTANLIRLLVAISRYPTANNVQDVLELMSTDIALALSQGVHSFGPVGGPSRTGHVFTQYGDYTAKIIGVDDTIPGISLIGISNPSVQDALQRLGGISGVTSFNGRVGAVVPTSGDYSATIVSHNDSVSCVILLPIGTVFGVNVQSAMNALKVHYHDATQIMMNPIVIPGCDTVQKSIQWLYDHRGSGALAWSAGILDTINLPITTTDVPVISSFTATPSSIVSGSSSTLSWTVTGATSLSINHSVGSVTGQTSKLVSPTSTTEYTLTATNADGSSTSSATVTVTTGVGPVLTGPDDTTVVEASTVTASFYVTAVNGAPFTYQWRKNGVDIPQAIGWSYVTPLLSISDNGNKYSVVVTNVNGLSTTSREATLTVTTAGTAPVITVQPQDVSISVGGTLDMPLTATGTAPLAYEWSWCPTGGSWLVIPEQTTNTYHQTGALESWTGKIRCKVSNSIGNVTSREATLTVTVASGSAPTITNQPVSYNVYVGDPITFYIDASGTAPLAYVWEYKNASTQVWVTLTSQTTRVCTVSSNAQLSDRGQVRCTVSNAYGSVVSQVAGVDVTEVAPDYYYLNVSRGDGVSGTPVDGFSGNKEAGSAILYSYALSPGYQDLVVTLDGAWEANQGSFAMDADHSLIASASPLALQPPTNAVIAPDEGQILQGGSTTLRWSADGATSYSVNGVDQGTATSMVVSPTTSTNFETTQYDLVASNADGTATAYCGVTAFVPVSIYNFYVSSAEVSTNLQNPQNLSIGWGVSDAISGTLDGGQFTGGYTISEFPHGEIENVSGTFPVPGTTIYTLTVVGALGSTDTATCSLTVVQA